jgi:hypothetical protein
VIRQDAAAAILIVTMLGEEDAVVGLLQRAPQMLLAAQVSRGDGEEVSPGLLVCIIFGLYRKESNEKSSSIARTNLEGNGELTILSLERTLLGAAWEAQIRRIMVRAQPSQKVGETPSQPNKLGMVVHM